MAKSTLDLALDYITLFPTRYIFPIKEGAKFPPLIRDNLDQASNDFAQILKWHTRWPGCNWGLALAKSKLLCADVDMKTGKVGAATYALLELLYEWPPTETTQTPSGGLHFLYAGRHVFALGKHGFGEDVDSPNYIIIPGCVTAEGAYTPQQSAPIADAPPWFYTILAEKSRAAVEQTSDVELDQPVFIERAIAIIVDHPASIEGAGGEKTLFDLGARLKDEGISLHKAVELVEMHYNRTWDIDRASDRGFCDPLWAIGDCDDNDSLLKKLENAYTYATANKPGSRTAEADFAADTGPIPPTPAQEKLKTQAATAETTEKRIDRIRRETAIIVQPPMFVLRSNKKLLSDRSFTKRYGIKADNINLDKKIVRYDGVVYRPALDPVEVFKERAGRLYNIFSPSGVLPLEGTPQFFLDHVAYLIPDPVEREHLLDWMAHKIQRPGEKMNFAILLVGPKGTGKSWLADLLRQLLGEDNVSTPTPKSIVRDFNGWAARKLLVIIHELKGKINLADELKDKITQAVVEVNIKNVEAFEIENYADFFMISNSEDAIPIDDDERRYLVLRCAALPRYAEARASEFGGKQYTLTQKSIDYYATVFSHSWARPHASTDEERRVLHWLMTRQIKLDCLSIAPETKAKVEMTEAGWSDLEHWMVDHADQYPLNCRVISIDNIMEALPARLERVQRLANQISSILRRRFKGVPRGSHRIGNGERASLWAINGTAATKIEGVNLGTIYELDRKKARTGAKTQAVQDFEEQVDD